jgi:6-pyruvoyl-tetrahydropterin synthase related domain
MFAAPIAFTANREHVSDRAGHQDVRDAFLVAIVAALAVLPIMIFGIPNGADLPNHLRFALPFYESLQAGHFHPGWLAESNYGLGDPRFIFYPPGLYYLLSAWRMLTGEWYSASILTFIVLSVTGGLGAYFWARTVFDSRIAMWAGILYVLAPYRLNELYQASLLSEYAACSILPFVFAFVERVIKRRRISDVAGLGASYALLILTHLPTAVIGSIALAIYALLRVYAKKARSGQPLNSLRENVLAPLGRLVLGVILGLAASSFFWTSMLSELSWIKGSASDPNPYYDYRLNFLFSPSALTNRNTWYGNILALAAIGFLLPGIAFIVGSFKRDKSNRALNAALVLLLLTFLMATSLSQPVWAVIPKLSEVQFPWRWLSITSLMGALAFAGSIPKWKERFRAKLRPRDFAVALAFALSLVFTGTQIIQEGDYIDRAKFEPMAHDVRGAVSFKDWLPVSARDFMNVQKMSVKVDAGVRPVTVGTWEAERRTFHLGPGAESILRVRTYFYPLWKARAGGRVLPTTASPDGLLLISAPTQAADIELTFEQPLKVHLFELVSTLSWILIIGSLVSVFIRVRRSRRYLAASQAIHP